MTDRAWAQHDAFEEWWSRDGRFIDPDTDDVPWFDKRKELCAMAFRAATAQSRNYIADDAAEPHQVTFANGRRVSLNPDGRFLEVALGDAGEAARPRPLTLDELGIPENPNIREAIDDVIVTRHSPIVVPYRLALAIDHLSLAVERYRKASAVPAQLQDWELRARELLWLTHGCPFSALYPDDGEMQCNNIARHGALDFKRDEWGRLRLATKTAQLREAAEALALPAPRQEGWQPIDSAPKDGTLVILALITNGTIWRIHDAKHNGLAWYTKAGGSLPQMTHWLPAPPSGPTEA